MSEFGDALRDAMKMRGLSQVQLGKNVGVSDCAISKYVNGISIPRKKRIASIEQSLGLERGTLQRCADADKSRLDEIDNCNIEEDDETREEKILKAWKRGERTPYEVAEITGYPIKVVKKYLPLGLER